MATTQEKWQEIANRGLQDRFDPDTRARFDEAVKRGLITFPEPLSFGDQALGALETAATIGSGIVAEPIAGLAGIAQSANPFADPGAGAEAVKATQEALTFQPKTEAGQAQIQGLGEAFAPIGEALSSVETALGQATLEATGSPELAAIAHTLPTAVLEALGLGAIRKGKSIAGRAPDQLPADIIEAGESLDIPVLTTDVLPPKSYPGRFFQSISEKLGPLGSGGRRKQQQAARENAVAGLAENLNIDLDSDFAAQIVDSLNTTSAAKLQEAGRIRGEAVATLDNFGRVPLQNTMQAISNQLNKQEALGARANSGVVQKLKDTASALTGGDFTQLKNIRSEVIADLIDIRKGDDTARAEPILQAVKSAIDTDMKDFASASDRGAAAKWNQSNRMFANELDKVKRTELKRILQSGQSTPEKVMPLLKGGRPSELNRLYGSLDESGRTAAKSAIIQDALKESRFFNVDESPNPNAFASAMNKPNRQQAVKVFFRGADKKELDGLTRLLNATRRAQDASVAPKTGELLTLPAIGTAATAGLLSSPAIAIPAALTASTLAKVYESKPFRTLMLKLQSSAPGSRIETGLLESALSSVVAGFQAAKTEQKDQK